MDKQITGRSLTLIVIDTQAKSGESIDNHEIVLRYNNAPTKGYEEYVGTKYTFKLLNRKWGDELMARAAPEESNKRKKANKVYKSITLLWRAESYHYYAMLRKKYPDEPMYLLAPQLLIPSISLY